MGGECLAGDNRAGGAYSHRGDLELLGQYALPECAIFRGWASAFAGGSGT